jgi:hypothetical protein
VKSGLRFVRPRHGQIPREIAVQSDRHPLGRDLPDRLERHDLPEGMDAGIGAAGRVQRHGMVHHPLDGGSEHILNGSLPLSL